MLCVCTHRGELILILLANTPSECTGGFAGLCPWENITVKVQHELWHSAFPAAVNKVRDFKCDCQNWQEEEENLQKSSVCNEQSWVFTEKVSFYCSLVCSGWVSPKRMTDCENHYALIFFFFFHFYPNVKIRLQSASAGVQRSLAIKFKLLSWRMTAQWWEETCKNNA